VVAYLSHAKADSISIAPQRSTSDTLAERVLGVAVNVSCGEIWTIGPNGSLWPFRASEGVMGRDVPVAGGRSSALCSSDRPRALPPPALPADT
jgi:hypothetical protein